MTISLDANRQFGGKAGQVRLSRQSSTPLSPDSNASMKSTMMPLVVAFVVLISFARFLPGQTQQQAHTDRKSLAITHATIIDVTGGPVKGDMTVLVLGDRIAAVGPESITAIPRGAQIVDARGKFLIPGLWDMHAHDGEKVFPLLIANGITGIRFMGDQQRPWTEYISALRARIADGSLLGPRIVAVGAIVDGSKLFLPRTATVATTAEEARQAVRGAKTRGDFVKVFDTLSRDAFVALAEECRKQGLPFVGHMPVYVNAGEASDAGMKGIEHFTGVLLASSARESTLRKRFIDIVTSALADPTQPNVTRDLARLIIPDPTQISELLDSYSAEKAADLLARFRKNGTWQCPTLRVWRLVATPEEFVRDPRLVYIPRADRNGWQRSPYASVSAVDAAARKRLLEAYLKLAYEARNAGVQFLAGSDMGVPFILPGFSLHDELAMFVEAGFTPLQALQTATINPARFLGLDSIGTIEAAKEADLVFLDADPLNDIRNTQKISGVLMRGRFLPKSELQAMLSAVQDAANKP